MTTEENTFVENFWTKIWDQRDVSQYFKADIAGREEYRIIEPYINHLAKGSRILDGGCGLGGWTIFFSSLGFETVGIDISENTIQRLTERFPEMRFSTGDIRCLPFDDAYFDAYLSWGTFEHFESGLDLCFREASRVLKKGGYLFLSIPFHNMRHWLRDKLPLHCVEPLYDRQHGYSSSLHFYQWRLTRQELQQLFAMHGFEVLFNRPINKAEGMRRMLYSDFGIPTDSTQSRILQFLLSTILPRGIVCHMLLGVGRKR